MAAAKKTPSVLPALSPGEAPADLPGKARELQFIETLFDRRMRQKDAKTRYFYDGSWILIVRGGKTSRLHPMGVIMGPEVAV
jgi:hypothetical protein